MANYNQFNSNNPGYNPNAGQQNFFNNVSPEIIHYGFSAGKDMLDKQRESWKPKMSSLWSSLKYYFAVNKSYVLSKLKVLLYPPSSNNWQRLRVDDADANGNYYGGSNESSSAGHKWALPKFDVNAVDLYIPSMTFLTYCILVCFSKGMSSDSVNMPDVFIQTVWRCSLLQVFESVLMLVGLHLMGVYVPFYDILGYTGYKYVGLCIVTLSLVFGKYIYFLVSLYMSAMLGYFILKTLAAVVPKEATGAGPLPRHIMLVLFAALQFFIAFGLSCF